MRIDMKGRYCSNQSLDLTPNGPVILFHFLSQSRLAPQPVCSSLYTTMVCSPKKLLAVATGLLISSAVGRTFERDLLYSTEIDALLP